MQMQTKGLVDELSSRTLRIYSPYDKEPNNNNRPILIKNKQRANILFNFTPMCYRIAFCPLHCIQTVTYCLFRDYSKFSYRLLGPRSSSPTVHYCCWSLINYSTLSHVQLESLNVVVPLRIIQTK